MTSMTLSAHRGEYRKAGPSCCAEHKRGCVYSIALVSSPNIAVGTVLRVVSRTGRSDGADAPSGGAGLLSLSTVGIPLPKAVRLAPDDVDDSLKLTRYDESLRAGLISDV